MGRPRRHRNPPRIEGDVAYIDLGRDGLEAIIDLDDLDRVSSGIWYVYYDRSSTGLVYAHGRVGSSAHPIRLHRFIMDAPKGVVIDHQNHNGLDCRKQNLRYCTTAQNGQYRSGPPRDNTSGVRGVYWKKRDQKWMAQVGVNGARVHVGVFDCLQEAEQATIEARRRLHGEFAS